MAERITTVKMTVTRNRSEHLNASRKDSGRKETKVVVSVLRVGGENKHYFVYNCTIAMKTTDDILGTDIYINYIQHVCTHTFHEGLYLLPQLQLPNIL